MVNDQFPGPLVEVVTNYNVVVDVKNKLDENLLVNWYVLPNEFSVLFIFVGW